MLTFWKHKVARTVASSLFLTVIACGQVDDAQDSETKVTNGLQASGEYPSVVLLHISTGPFSGSICTGTFVNDSQVVTAAHCVYDVLKAGRPASSLTFDKPQSGGSSKRVAATSLKYHPGYTVVPGRLSNHDVAVVTFPRYSAPATTKLYPRTPYIGQKFTIVGFGVNDYKYDASGQQTGSGSGVKRKGENQIDQVDNGMIKFSGVPTAYDTEVSLGKDAASGSGDSGGPMLIDGSLAAVTSGGALSQGRDEDGDWETVKVSNYVDLNESLNKDFLQDNLL
jgi:secreted trypsin-like serine protease